MVEVMMAIRQMLTAAGLPPRPERSENNPLPLLQSLNPSLRRHGTLAYARNGLIWLEPPLFWPELCCVVANWVIAFEEMEVVVKCLERVFIDSRVPDSWIGPFLDSAPVLARERPDFRVHLAEPGSLEALVRAVHRLVRG